MRQEAEERARVIEKNKIIDLNREKRIEQRLADNVEKKRRETLMMNAADVTSNSTPNEARLAEIDFRFNGGRARVDSGDFIHPRWIPDEEVMNCGLCHTTFDWVRRKHHCRSLHIDLFFTLSNIYTLSLTLSH